MSDSSNLNETTPTIDLLQVEEGKCEVPDCLFTSPTGKEYCRDHQEWSQNRGIVFAARVEQTEIGSFQGKYEIQGS